MSWIDRIKTDFTITTGDGAAYVPNMVNASKNVEYNVARFEFIETAGSLVKRGTPRGTQYAIEIFFQGETHLDIAQAFEVSAANPGPWTISHPMYGQLLVQPLTLTFDNAMLNVTRIMGAVVETIRDAPDQPGVSPAEVIQQDKVDADTSFAVDLGYEVPEPTAADVQGMISGLAGAYNAALSSISNAANAQGFVNAFNLANSALTSASSNALNTFEQLQQFYSLPMTFTDTVVNRIAMLTNMLAFINGQIREDITRSGKFIYQATAGTILSAIIGTIAYGTANAFGTRRQTLGVLTSLLGTYDDYLARLDDLQTPTGSLRTSFIPSLGPLVTLAKLISYASTTLLDIADRSRQERTVIVVDDTNIILLASELVGLKADDSTIEELVDINQLGYFDLCGLKKGRHITYYL